REILMASGPDFDTAVFSDVRANYSVVTVGGVTTVSHIVGGVPGPDGTDRLTHIERLQFADLSQTLGGVNNAPVGLLTILDAATNTPDPTPTEDQLLRVSIAGVIDADNPTGAITGPVAYFWQHEVEPGTSIFEDMTVFAAGEVSRVVGPTFRPGDAEVGEVLRV